MKQRGTSPWLTGFLVLVVISLVMAALYMSRPDPPQQMAPEPAAAPVHVRTLEEASRNHRIRIYGQTRARLSTTVAIDQSGLVTWRAPQLEIGQSVAPGLPLIQLDSQRAELAVQAARAAQASAVSTVKWRQADVAVADAEVKNAAAAEPVARRELERQKAMAAGGVTPESATDQAEIAWLAADGRLKMAKQSLASAEAARAAAQSQLEAAAVALSQAELELQRCELAAPIGGEVIAAMVEVGQWLSPGMPVCQIVDRTTLLVDAPLPNSDGVLDPTGLKATVSFPAYLDARGSLLEFEADVFGFAPNAAAQSRARVLQLEFDNRSRNLPTGAFAEVWLDQGQRTAIWLAPSDFRVGDHGPEAVAVVDGKAQVRELRFGRTLIDADGNSWHPVLEGLSAGDVIAVDNLETPRDGDPLLVVR